MANITNEFLDRLMSINESTLTERVLVQAKRCVLDYLGVVSAGATMLRKENKKYLSLLRNIKGDSTIIGLTKQADIYSAILLNGLNAHVAELDDGHRFGMLHLGAPIISSLWSVAEAEEVSGKDFLNGIIVGYEAAILLACAMQPFHRNRGYHTTGTCGTIGASMGIAAALRFTFEQTKAALSAAVSSAAGVLELQEDGSNLKAYNAGRAAFDGFTAAMIGRAGFVAPGDILGGRRGFFSIMSDQILTSSFFRDANDRLEIEDIYMKPYASCRHSHSAIEAALELTKNHGLSCDEIKKINVYTYKTAVDGHDHREVQGVGSAKMSIPYSVAVALVTGRAGIREFSEEYLNDDYVGHLARQTSVLESSELTELVPGKRAAIVEVITLDNRRLSARVNHAKGEPENPMTTEEIEEKFKSLIVFSGKTLIEAQRIVDMVWDIENRLGELFDLV